MKTIFKKISYLLLVIASIWALPLSNTIQPMQEAKKRETHKSHVTFSPAKGTGIYGGLGKTEHIIKNNVSSCVSLGGSCLEKVNDIIKTADQFVVSFMYRFNSPTLMRTLENKHLSSIPVISFLDYNQTYEMSSEGSRYSNYVQRLIQSIPTSLVKLGDRAFHQKVIISKKKDEQAVVILGSANATFEADNEHSEDLLFIQSNTLARIYLEEFKNLMRMEPSSKSKEVKFLAEQKVKVFHEHRVKTDVSNIDYLDTLKEELKLDSEKSTLVTGHVGDVVSLAISTGFPDDKGTQKCLDVVNSALGDHRNEFLFLFENFISLNRELITENIWGNLQNKTPKLIVLDKNKHNVAALNGGYEFLLMSDLPKNNTPLAGKIYLEKSGDKLTYTYMSEGNEIAKGVLDIKIKNKKLTYPVLSGLKSQILKEIPNLTLKRLATEHNNVLLFKPFSGGKFHHKLIIQYPQEEQAVVYTGSFHISTNAIKRNSENIIGIRSESLADEHLASILLNSGLGEVPETWRFIKKYPRLRQISNKESMVLQIARKISQKCKANMDRYFERLERIEEDIGLAANDADDQQTIENYFRHYTDQFHSDSSEEDKSGANEGLKDHFRPDSSAAEKLEAIEGLKEAVFKPNGAIVTIYTKHLNNQRKYIKGKIKGIEKLPDFGEPTWLKEMADWIEDTKEDAKREGVNIKEEIKSIETIYIALRDLDEYEATFANLYELHTTLNEFF